MRVIQIPAVLLAVAMAAAFLSPNPEAAAAVSPRRAPGLAPPAIGDSCHSENPDKLCLALKYVTLKDSARDPGAARAQVLKNLDSINGVWKQCGIEFQIEEHTVAAPSDYNVPASPSAMKDLDRLRNAFGEEDSLLIISTVGKWKLKANAWTAMPGAGPYGAVIEGTVADYGPIIAHELGHYLNLGHTRDTQTLMNPVIYSYSKKFAPGTCAQAREAVTSFWAKALR